MAEDGLQDTHYVVGIGASAGGMEAIQQFFQNTPPSTGFSFVIIQHLSPDYKSMLVDILSRQINAKVMEAEDNLPVEPNVIYVIPNDKYVIYNEGKLKLAERDGSHPNTPIDLFFDSLAKGQGDQSIGIILSGTGTDGTKGIEQIRKAGGLVFVQEPSTAKFDGMPNNAINSGNADFILSPESMWDELLTFSRQKPLNGIITDVLSPLDETILFEILTLVKNKTSCDFTHYKRPTIARRLTRRMAIVNYKTLSSYYEYLKINPDEVEILSKEFLIGVTQFYRDSEAFDVVKEKILPEIIQKKGIDEAIKIWCAGCSTGEEAYSIAILLKEVLLQLNRETDVKIFATDLDKEAIDFASKGVYSNEIEEQVSAVRLKNYFYKEGDKYRVHSDIRKMIIFSHHDVIKDPPFSKTDLISCRNMLIYLNPLLQRRCLSIFHFSLNVGGYLFLGPSENIGELSGSFGEVNKKWKIFQNLEKSKGFKMEGLPSSSQKVYHSQLARLKQTYENSFVESFNKNLLEEFHSTGIYVDSNFNIIETFGNYKRYLHFPDEKFNVSLLRMLPEELAILLGTNLRKAARDNEKVKLRNIRTAVNGEHVCLNITIKPADNTVHQKALMLLIAEVEDTKAIIAEKPDPNLQNLSIEHFLTLEQELRETKEILQRAIEESESSNEELQSSNEELISSNEELQSTNEELQSLNEELHTVNSEHQSRIKEISDLNDDLNNYFRSTDIGKVFLDKNLIIRKFTPSVTKFFNLIENDIGRSITHFSNNLNYSNLLEDLHHVMSTSYILKKEVHKGEDKWYEMKILPYIRRDSLVDGVIITFTDITDLKLLNTQLEKKVNERTKALAEINERYLLVSKATNDAIWDWNLITNEVTWNEGFKKMFGYKDEEIEPTSDSWYNRIHSDERESVVKSKHHVIDHGEKNWTESYRFKRSDGSYATVLDRGYCLHDENGKAYRMVGSMQDVSELEKSKEAIRVREEFLTRMIGSSEDCIKVLDLSGNLLSMNDGGKLLVEIKDFSLWEGKSWFDFWRGEERNESMKAFEQAMAEGKGRFFGYCPTAETKTPKWWDVLITPILGKDGKPEKVLAVSRDVTIRKHLMDELNEKNETLQILNQIGKTISSELKLDKVVQAVTDAATKISGAEFGAFFYNIINEKGEAYTLYTISGVPREMFSKFPMPRNTQIFEPTFHGSGIVRSDDITKDPRYGKNAPYHGMPKGHLPVVSYLAVPVISRTGEVIGGLFFGHSKPGVFTQKVEDSIMAIASQAATAMDNSKLYEAAQMAKANLATINEDLQSKNEELQKINVDLDNFIYTASHDLKAPVSNIEGLISTLSDELKGDSINKQDVYPILEMINASITRFANTIKDLTTITKIQKDIEEEREDVKIDDLIQDFKIMNAELIKSSHAKIIATCDDCPSVNFSRKNLKSVLFNLITNAIKYRSPERDPEVHISTSWEKEFIVLKVKDNGLGLEKSKQSKLFSMFRRFHDHVEGTGIGLYIVKRIVTNAGGTVAVESEPGIGSEFKVYFKAN